MSILAAFIVGAFIAYRLYCLWCWQDQQGEDEEQPEDEEPAEDGVPSWWRRRP